MQTCRPSPGKCQRQIEPAVCRGISYFPTAVSHCQGLWPASFLLWYLARQSREQRCPETECPGGDPEASQLSKWYGRVESQAGRFSFLGAQRVGNLSLTPWRARPYLPRVFHKEAVLHSGPLLSRTWSTGQLSILGGNSSKTDSSHVFNLRHLTSGMPHFTEMKNRRLCDMIGTWNTPGIAEAKPKTRLLSADDANTDNTDSRSYITKEKSRLPCGKAISLPPSPPPPSAPPPLPPPPPPPKMLEIPPPSPSERWFEGWSAGLFNGIPKAACPMAAPLAM